MKILWANAFCLLDSSSGASMSVRQILLQLVNRGVEVHILGATNFDSTRGAAVLEPHKDQLQGQKAVNLKDGPLTHRLIVTERNQVRDMTVDEIAEWFLLYEAMLDNLKPDILFLYGGKPHDFLVMSEAKNRGIPVVFYLVNGNYNGSRWHRDIDMVITDSHATANLYQERLGIKVKPFGKFIDPNRFVAKTHTRKNILFINPSLAKGGLIAVQVAKILEDKRPDITFEVVESRGKWSDVVEQMRETLGLKGDSLANVQLTNNSRDMRPVYARARILFHPSLWWESGSRVLAEATLNGIPSIITTHGGSQEMVGNAGIILNLPEKCFEKPYNAIPQTQLLVPLVDMMIRMYDDESFYRDYVRRAYAIGKERHNIEKNTDCLFDALGNLVDDNNLNREKN